MKSIQSEMTRALVLRLIAIFTVCGIGLYAYTHYSVARNLLVSVVKESETLLDSIEVDEEGIEVGIAEGEKSYLRQYGFFRVWRDDGSIIDESDWMKDFDLEASGAPVTNGSLHRFRAFNLRLPNEERGIAVAHRIKPNVDPDEEDDDDHEEEVALSSESVNVFYARPRTNVDAFLVRIALGFVLVGGLLAATVAFAVPSIIGKGLAPVNAISNEAAALNPETLDHRFETESLPPELLPIAESLNAMLARVESAFTREKRFTADAAHELRTPIAELRTLTEVELRSLPPGDDRRDYLEDALSVTNHMEHLVEALLQLARGEDFDVQHANESVDFEALVRDVWRAFDAEATRCGYDLEFDIHEGTVFDGPPTLIRAIVSNLLNNAVAHTPMGGMIKVVASSRGYFRCVIENTNQNLTEDDIPHLFEPFWRKDKARSGSNHSGIGLAIVKEFADRIGLKVTAELTSADNVRIKLKSRK